MSIITDIANWVTQDYLVRPDLQTFANVAATDVYRMICACVPFDELQATSMEFPMVAGQDTYTLGSDWVLDPKLRAIQNLRIVFDSTNKRRLRRSHVRVYDSLSISSNSRPSTYARWDTQLQFNPPPDSSSYTIRFRYWFRPNIGLPDYAVTAASWGTGTAVYTIGTHGINVGDIVSIQGVLPTAYAAFRQPVTAIAATSISVAIANNPGTWISGGMVTDNTAQWNTSMLTPPDWDELFKYETLYRVLQFLNRPDEAFALMQPSMLPRQASPKKTRIFESAIIPRLWNDLLTTVSQKENVDEDFNVNPVVRPYSVRA